MSGAREQQHTVFGSAAVLAAGALIVKIIGAIYKIPLSNILGDLGFGHFNNAYVIFNVLMTIATAGLPVALSKSISEANALGQFRQVRKIFSVALVTFLVLGGLSFVIMFFGATPLAAWMGNTGAVYAIRAMAPCAFFLCAMSGFRGYAQGHLNMVPTSVSQIIEALLKLFVGLVLAWYVVSMPMTDAMLDPDLLAGLNAGEVADALHALRYELAAGGAILGVTAGALAGLMYLIVDYMRGQKAAPFGGTLKVDRAGVILARLTKIAVPITLGSSVMSLVTFIDTNLVQHRLQGALGFAETEAVALYGAYQRAMALYALPSYFIVPLTASIVPAIAACLARREGKEAGRISESAVRMTALIACPAGVGLAVLATPIIALLYKGTNLAVAGDALVVLGIASIFVCIMLICNAILQANGFVNLPIITAVLGGLVKLAVNYILVGNPEIGILGAPVGTLCCFVLVAALDVVIVWRVVPARPRFLRAFYKPLIASLLMGGAAWGVNGLLEGVVGVRLAVVAAIGVGGVLYLLLVLLLRILTLDDLALMPKGEKIAKFLHLQ